MVITKTRREIKPVLMSPKARGVKEPYYLIQDGEQIIFVVSPGQNGAEFNKTTGYFSKFPAILTYQCLYGQGLLLMQRNDELEEAKEFKVITLHPGRQVAVPASWAMCLVNVGRGFLVVVRNGLIDPKDLDSRPIEEKQGLAYYIVEKKGEIGFEPNPNYSVHPQIATE